MNEIFAITTQLHYWVLLLYIIGRCSRRSPLSKTSHKCKSSPPKSIRDRQVILGRRKIWEMQPKYQSFRQLRISLQRTSCLLNVSLGPHCPPRHSRAPEHHINHYSLSMIVSITLIPLKLLLELKARVTGKKSSGLPPTLNSRLPLLLFESINGCWRETLILVREGA